MVRALTDEPFGTLPDAPLPELWEEDTQGFRGDRTVLLDLVPRIRRYKTDFPLFCLDNLKIKDKANRLIPFEFKRAQERVWEEHYLPKLQADQPIRVYLLKSRQIGFSTMSEAYLFWREALWANSNAFVTAHTDKAARNIFRMFQLFWKTAPKDFRPIQKLANRQEMLFANPSDAGDIGLESLIAVATARDEDLGASFTISNAHLSEFARYPRAATDLSQVLATFLQTIPDFTSSAVILETTGEGDNEAAAFWRRGSFTNIFIPWTADESYTEKVPIDPNLLSADPLSRYGDEIEAQGYIRDQLYEWWPEKAEDNEWVAHETLCRLYWRRLAIDEKTDGKLHLFHKQYPLHPEEALSTGGSGVFDPRILAYQKKRIEDELVVSPPRTYDYNHDEDNWYVRENGPFRVFEAPLDGEQYVIGADAAAGSEDGDPSAFQILRLRDDGNVVQTATYENWIEPFDFGDTIIAASKLYRNAFVVPESTGMGQGLIDWLKRQNFFNMWVRRRQVDSFAVDFTEKWGFHTNAQTKPTLIAGLQRVIRHNDIELHDPRTVKQLMSYSVNERGTMGAPAGSHDDLVMALCLAYMGLVHRQTERVKQSRELTDFQKFKMGLDRQAGPNYRTVTTI